MNSALHQAVSLEAAQCLRKHFLRNPSDLALQCSVAHRSPRENLDDQSRPFIRNPIKHQPGWTLRFQYRRRCGRFGHIFF